MLAPRTSFGILLLAQIHHLRLNSVRLTLAARAAKFVVCEIRCGIGLYCTYSVDGRVPPLNTPTINALAPIFWGRVVFKGAWQLYNMQNNVIIKDLYEKLSNKPSTTQIHTLTRILVTHLELTIQHPQTTSFL